ncbi:MAG: hypothetical protein ACKOOG_15670, partial [Actinomycetota bacterium]
MLGLATLLTVSALAATLLASAAGAADPLAEIEARITAAQVAADRAAAAYGAAETRAAELEAEVVRTRRAIADELVEVGVVVGVAVGGLEVDAEATGPAVLQEGGAGQHGDERRARHG